MLTRHFEINGAPSILVGTRDRITTRTDFASEAEAAGFADGLRRRGFEPRTLDNDSTWIVTMQTTPADVMRLVGRRVRS